MNVIFGYDHYKEMFPHCDKFNTNLHDRTHPHRTGSGKQPGEEGHTDTMAMALILQNTFTLYEYLNDVPSTGQGSLYFEDHGVALAVELFDSLNFMVSFKRNKSVLWRSNINHIASAHCR